MSAHEVRELAIELALPLDVAERVLAYGKQERRAGHDAALMEVEQGIALPATICNRIAAAVQAERERSFAEAEAACEAERDEQQEAAGAAPNIGAPFAFAASGAEICRAAIASLRLGGPSATDALAAALAQARREGMEKAACLLEAMARCSDTEEQAYAKWLVKELRSAAAGEEGK